MGVLTPTGAVRAWWSVLMVVVSAVGIAAGGVAYTNRVQRQADERQQEARRVADQRWCDLLATLDQPSPAPTTERGQELQRQVRQLRVDLGCVPGRRP